MVGYNLCVVCYIQVNEPDLVLFVGEALVGNEAVDQLVKFNQALADFSSSDNPHTVDGIVLTKFDTIDDKVILIQTRFFGFIQYVTHCSRVYCRWVPPFR